jgi:hypothetical protein
MGTVFLRFVTRRANFYGLPQRGNGREYIICLRKFSGSLGCGLYIKKKIISFYVKKKLTKGIQGVLFPIFI